MKDQLSALIDGEFGLEDAEHIITSVKSGGELKEAWQYYHLIGDVMRGNVYMHYDFSARVMQVLEAEPTVLATHQAASVKPVLVSNYKLAKLWPVAASVAAVMFVGLMVMQQQFDAADDMSPVEIAQSVPMEYLEAHQAAAPSGAAYYIQTTSFVEQQQ